MKCPTCGAEVQSGQSYCPSCGAKLTAEQGWGNPQTPTATMENKEISKREYCKNYAPDKLRKNIVGSAIVCYISAALTGALGVLFNPMMLVDAAIVLLLGLGIHLKQSRACSVILLVYGVFSCIMMLIQTGRLGSWLIILAGVYAVMYTFKLEKEYRAFRGE